MTQYFHKIVTGRMTLVPLLSQTVTYSSNLMVRFKKFQLFSFYLRLRFTRFSQLLIFFAYLLLCQTRFFTRDVFERVCHFFYIFRTTSSLITHWFWSTKICSEILTRFTLLVTKRKDSLMSSLELRNWFEVRILQVGVGWLYRLGFSRWGFIRVDSNNRS